MKLRSYQHFVVLFVLTTSVRIFDLTGQSPLKLPEGVSPESNFAYTKHLEQIQEKHSEKGILIILNQAQLGNSNIMI